MRATTSAATYPDATYERRLPGNVKVAFSAAGLHVGTSNLQAHYTKFGYYNDGKLHSIYVPWQPGYTGQNLRYGFEYDPNDRWLRQVTAPDLSNNRSRTVGVGTGSDDGRVGWIQDPDTSLVQFSYATSRPWVPETRTDRRQTVTRFGYDAGGKLASSKVEMRGAEDDLQTYFLPHETRGIEAAVRGDSVFTIHEGPRLRTICPFLGPCISPAGDYSRFWIDRWGAPRRIVNPLGDTTVLTRGHPQFPALVTHSMAPNGLTSLAWYNGRGGVDSTSVRNPLGDGRNATTRYTYDRVWKDFVTRVTTPMNEITEIEYDSATGNRLWQQVGGQVATRVTFGYHPAGYGSGAGLLASITSPATATSPAATEHLLYDGASNLRGTISPRLVQTDLLNDPLGRVIRTRTPIQGSLVLVDTVVYDVMNRVRHTESFGPSTNGVLAQALVVDNEYDEEGNLKVVSRRSVPDSAFVGTITTRFHYDRAGRQIAEIAPDGMADSTFYDPAGNPIRLRSRRHAEFVQAAGGDSAAAYITIRYDQLNRPVERQIPAVRYAGRRAGIAGGSSLEALKQEAYPYYPTDGGTGLLLSGDTVRFVYDGMGNLTRAENHDSWIRRSYYPNGALKGDTLRTRTLAEVASGGDSTSHVYALLHVYDLNGRRVELHHPSQLAPRATGAAPLPTRFGYDPVFGALNRVTDPLSNEFRYVYNARGQQDSLYMPGGIREHYAYDADGNITEHRVYNGAPSVLVNRYPGSWIRDETLEYDLRGKMLRSANQHGLRDTASVDYTGLGHMAWSTNVAHGFQYLTGQDARYVDNETPRHDALGNIYSMARSGQTQVFARTWLDAGSSSTSSSNTLWTYQAGTSRLLLRMTPSGVDSTHYDLAGNIVFTNQSATVGSTAFDRASFYDAEGRLRVAETRRLENYGSKTPPFYMVFEEYRYDALGRRIVVHTRKDCKNHGQDLRPCAVGTLRRTVWDGTAELYDIQVPVSSANSLVNIFFTAAEMESDTNWVRSNLGNWDGYDPYPMYGRVAYSYGHAIDKPLSIVRMNYADRPYGQGYHAWVEPFAIVPHWNMRGAAQTGTYASGERQRCKPVDGTTRCVYLDWHAGWFPYNPARPVPEHWHGSLLNEKRDGSGLLYRRNRYYDPSSSRFTQEDPIGLAGGLNVYGFAAGDPVTYSDPYGLKAESNCCPQWLADAAAGFGDAVSFGLTNIVRERMGTNTEVDRSSGSYQGATVVGMGAGIVVSGGASGAASTTGRAANAGRITGYTRHGLHQAIFAMVSGSQHEPFATRWQTPQEP